MEDVLEVYSRAPRQDRPLVCLDEFAKQLLSETRAPVAAIPGHLAREDYEYVREGSVSGFMIAMPHLGRRDVFVGGDGRRTALDFAACLDHLANTLLPDAAKIVLVMDNLNTHKEASLYEAFPPEKARAHSRQVKARIADSTGDFRVRLSRSTCLGSGSNASNSARSRALISRTARRS